MLREIGLDGIIFGLQNFGGISTYSWELLSRLSGERNCQVTLGLPKIVLSDRASALTNLNLSIVREKRPVQISRYLSTDLSSPVVHSTYYRTPRTEKCKSVITVYDFVYERYREGVAKTVHSAQKRRACMQADKILCISENTRIDLLNTYPEVDPQKVSVTPLAVDHQNFFPNPLPRNDLCDTVIFVGQRTGYKRFQLAAESALLAGLKFAIVGSPLLGAEKKMLNTIMKDRWQELGKVSNSELREIYSNAFALIYPSDYEGFGLPLLEAQACGCPVVAANLSSLPEVGGLAVGYADSQTKEAYSWQLERLFDRNYRRTKVEAGISNAKNYNWDQTFDLTMAAYQNLLD
ncbi:MAG: glycosyltransferase family 1 protein [Pseudomonadota bacterium]